MNLRLARALVSGAVFWFASAAQASTVQFASSVTFTESVNNVAFASSGLNSTLTVGVPDIISQFITVTVGTGSWTASHSSLTANFNFTIPTPIGTTTDGGTISVAQVNVSGKKGTLSIIWPNQPVEFDFTDGTRLDVTLGSLVNRVRREKLHRRHFIYYMAGTFLVLNGPTTGDLNGPTTFGAAVDSTTPIPAALPLFASGLGAFGFYCWRRKKKAAALAA
jgi:hypothetical protein